jgi:hypothetical protein
MTQKIPQPRMAFFPVEFSAADHSALEEAGGTRLSEEVKVELQAAYLDFQGARQADLAAERAGNVRPPLERLRASCKRMSMSLDELAENSTVAGSAREAIRQARFRPTYGHEFDELLREMRGNIEMLGSGAALALESLQADIGAPANRARNTFIIIAQAIFERVTGKGPYNAGSLRFLSTLIRLTHGPITEGALIAVLKGWKKVR